jgi:Methyltransferase domain
MNASLIEEERRHQRRFPWLGVVTPIALLIGFLAYPYFTVRLLWPSVAITPDPAAHPYKHEYRFTTDWFTQNIPIWASALKAYAGKPGVQYLEVGTWEGRSVLWTLDNILTDPTSHATAIDPFIDDPGWPQSKDIKGTFLSNLRLSGQADRVSVIVGFSQIELRKLPLESYDVIYIDGSHRSDDTLEDLVLSSRLLKPNGVLIMDDYRLYAFGNGYRSWFDRPQFSMDAFHAAFRDRFAVLHYDYQVILKKKPVIP